jgi:hypothetical protein
VGCHTYLMKAAGMCDRRAWFHALSASTDSREEGTTQSACGHDTAHECGRAFTEQRAEDIRQCKQHDCMRLHAS